MRVEGRVERVEGRVEGRVEEEDAGDGAWGEEGGDGLEGFGFAEGAFGAGAPVGFDAEFFEGLFADDAAGGAFGEQDGIRDAAAEGENGRFQGAGPGGAVEVFAGVIGS